MADTELCIEREGEELTVLVEEGGARRGGDGVVAHPCETVLLEMGYELRGKGLAGVGRGSGMVGGEDGGCVKRREPAKHGGSCTK